MDDEIALLRGIVIDPYCDVRRLAYADWLDERGAPEDAARAEFIRLQIARARDANPASGNIPLAELHLLNEFEGRWRHGLPEAIRERWFVRYECGFPSMLECDAGLLIDAWGRAPVLLPVETLTLHVGAASPAWVHLRRPEPMFPLRYLRVSCDPPVGSQLMGVLLRLGPFPWLEDFAVRDEFLSDAALADFAPEPLFPRLKRLSFAGCNLTDDGAETLAVSAWAGRLERLDLTGNRFSPNLTAWLLDRFGPALVV